MTTEPDRRRIARQVRAAGRLIAERMEEMQAPLCDEPYATMYREAAGSLDDALDRIDSAIRTLEDDEPDLSHVRALEEQLPGECTGYYAPVPPHGGLMLMHDGDTCPVHEVKTIGPGGINRSSATIAGDDTAGTEEHNSRAPIDGIAASEAELHALELIVVTLDAMEPAALLEPALAGGITLTVHSSGLAVTLNGPRASVYALIAEQWGDKAQAAELTGYSPPQSFGTVGDVIGEAADACETLADIDEGEHVDDERLRAIAEKLHAYVAANLASLDEPA